MSITLTIKGDLLTENGLPIEPEMLAFAYRTAARWPSTHITIYTDDRVPDDAPPYRSPGQIEWVMAVVNPEGKRIITMCLLQRTKTSPFESHS